MSGIAVQESSESSSVDGLSSTVSNMRIGGRSDPGVPHPAGDRRSDDENVYKMNNRQRGKFILINNKTFLPNTGMNERTGTDVDASNLKRAFTNLGFTVERHDNKRAIEMLRIMERAGQEDHADSDCIAVAVLSHGEQGVLYGIDGTITNEQLVEPIKKCLSLAGKPKLFFFQACRGNQLDDGQELYKDADPEGPREKELIGRIPQEADFLFAYSTTPGYFSWRNSNKGSWFVQALCQVLNDPASKDFDFLRVMTRVNKKVAYEFESNASQLHMTRKKQASSIVSQLTKDLYLTLPKK